MLAAGYTYCGTAILTASLPIVLLLGGRGGCNDLRNGEICLLVSLLFPWHAAKQHITRCYSCNGREGSFFLPSTPTHLLILMYPCYFCTQGRCPTLPTLVTLLALSSRHAWNSAVYIWNLGLLEGLCNHHEVYFGAQFCMLWNSKDMEEKPFPIYTIAAAYPSAFPVPR